VFAGSKHEWPWLTRAMLALSDVVRHQGWLMFLLAVFYDLQAPDNVKRLFKPSIYGASPTNSLN
jgi:hypothetical protein